jgi:Predicted nucleotidyltransferase.
MTEYGNVEFLDGEILRSVVGSGVHGIAIEGTDDHDEMGVYVEPPRVALGLRLFYTEDGRDRKYHRYREDYIWRTQPEGARSGPGDTDLVVYSLRKYLSLAMKGNPTALLPLFAPEESLLISTDLGDNLRQHRHMFLSNEAVCRFLAYMDAQHERMIGGGKRNRVPDRPELVAKHGWDTKYGSHALRLAHQGYELASEGHLTLPLKPESRERVLAVKRGEVDPNSVSEEITKLAGKIRQLLDEDKTPLPDYANLELIDSWSVSAHMGFWEGKIR